MDLINWNLDKVLPIPPLILKALVEHNFNLTRYNFWMLIFMAVILPSRVVYLNFRAGSFIPIPVCTVSTGKWLNEADTQ